MTPYRIAPRRCEPRPKRPTILRLRAAGDRSHSPYPFTRRRVVRHLGAYALSGIFYAPAMLSVPDVWTAWIRWPIYFAAAVLSWAIVDTLLGMRRLLVARRAMRAWHRKDAVRAVVTTFPRLAAYRELARTGDVEAFAARRDLDPVTRPICSLSEDAEAALNAARRAQVAAEEVSEMLKERAHTIVITPPDAAIKATVLVLTDEERRGLTTDLDELGPVK